MIPNGGRGGSPADTVALVGDMVAVALDPPELARADLVIAGGRIAAVGTAPQGTARRDCSGTLIIPGNVCAHHHLYSALARGMPYDLEPPANFLQILQRVWWRLDRALDEPAIRLSALRGGLDALLAGTTTRPSSRPRRRPGPGSSGTGARSSTRSATTCG
jgi:cytosine/adenosine deaminase-related metal-dependent hydrolase